MEDTDKFGFSRTLQDQFLAVQKLTTQSKVMQWGDISWTNMTLANFQGEPSQMNQAEPIPEEREFSGAEPAVYSADELRSMSAVKTYDIPMHLAYYQYLRDEGKDMLSNHALLQELTAELNMRLATDKLFMSMTSNLAGANANEALVGRNTAPANWQCLDFAQRAYKLNCGEFTDYARKYVRVLNNLCLMNIPVAAIEGQLSAMCPLKF